MTPQPRANAVPGGRSIEIQDVCPGRRFVTGYDHIQMAGDAVAYALAVDALDHPGPADPARVSRANCALELFPGADAVKLATLAPALVASARGEGYGPEVDREPALRCPFAAGCDVVASLRLVRPRSRAGGRVVLRVRAARPGRVRLRSGSRRSEARAVPMGRSTVRFARGPSATGPGAVLVEAQSVPGTPWATVATLRRTAGFARRAAD